jgi:hypothetical protein
MGRYQGQTTVLHHSLDKEKPSNVTFVFELSMNVFVLHGIYQRAMAVFDKVRVSTYAAGLPT